MRERPYAGTVEGYRLSVPQMEQIDSMESGHQPGDPWHPAPRRAVRVPHRTGVLGWWLNLTAPPWPVHEVSIAERERLRKAELTSYSILAVFIFLLMLVSNSLADPSTGEGVASMAVGLFVAAVLNRTGRTRTAAYLIPLLQMVVLMGAILQARGGFRLIWLPTYDLFVLPIFISSLIADRRAPWIFASMTIAFIIGDFTFQPHPAFGEIDRELAVWGWWGMVNRHVALALFAAFFGWLGARSVDLAIRRADRAEEIAAMEHVLADQKRQLDVGIRQILETHVRVANGDFNARAPLTQDNVLFQIAASLNNLLNRLGRAGQSEYLYQRTVAEIARLRDSLRAAKSGRAPLWPAPSGTPVDELLQVIAGPVRGAPGLSGQLPPTATSAPSSAPWAAPSPSSAPWAMSAPSPSSGPSSGPWGTPGDFWPPQTSPALPDMPMGSNLQGPAPNPGGWGVDSPHASPQPAPYPQQSPQSANPWESPPLSDWPPPGEPNARG